VKACFEGCKLVKEVRHPDSIYGNHIASVYGEMEMMDK
jgi:hypothetical protein